MRQVWKILGMSTVIIKLKSSNSSQAPLPIWATPFLLDNWQIPNPPITRLAISSSKRIIRNYDNYWDYATFSTLCTQLCAICNADKNNLWKGHPNHFDTLAEDCLPAVQAMNQNLITSLVLFFGEWRVPRIWTPTVFHCQVACVLLEQQPENQTNRLVTGLHHSTTWGAHPTT